MRQQSDLEIKFATNFLKYWRIIQKSFLTKISKKDSKHGNSCPEVFCTVDFLKNFERFTGKHLCQGFFFNKVAG